MTKLHFKFRDDAADGDRNAVLKRLIACGARARRLFPDEEAGELANMYGVDCAAEERKRLLEELSKDRSVEFAEHAVRRQLIR
ncbi:MAG TPA: hypothetical protein VF618_08810 [Thermoanaerobaculia bacterium]